MGRADPRHWRLWSLPRGVAAYVLVIVVLAATVVAVTGARASVTGWEWAWFGALTVAAIVHLEAARAIERIRELDEGTPYTHLQSVWFFAAILLLPVPLQAALIAISFSHEFVRVFRGRAILHRKVFSAATVILAVAAATLVLNAFYPAAPGPFVSAADGLTGTVSVVIAGLAYRLVNYTLVIGAILAANPGKPAMRALGHLSDQLIIAGAVGLGYAVAVLAVHRPWAVPILLATVLALHLGLLLPQFRAASRTDTKTGLVDPAWWNDLAEQELERARRLDGTVGVLLLDLDHFKRVNDRYGHLAGDAVLRAVADAVKHTVRSYDLVGRFGGEEFAILLPGVEHTEVTATADRIRAAISVLSIDTTDRTGARVTVTGLTASIGAGAFPATATELSPLLLTVDDALYRAKNGGRDRTVRATALDASGSRQ